MPTGCSLIFRNVFKLRSLARQYISFKIGNGLGTSLWFDLWWNSTCLATNRTDPIIAQANLTCNATIHTLISTGNWVLPRPSSRIHHLQSGLTSWLQHFDYPDFDLGTLDQISWNDLPLGKVKAWHIWNSLRIASPQVTWYGFVWHTFRILRYAHHGWVLYHGRLLTLHRLASFGLDVSPFCHLCVGGIETNSHLFVTCPFTSFILLKLAGIVKVGFVGLSQVEVLTYLGNIPDRSLRDVAHSSDIFLSHMEGEKCETSW